MVLGMSVCASPVQAASIKSIHFQVTASHLGYGGGTNYLVDIQVTAVSTDNSNYYCSSYKAAGPSISGGHWGASCINKNGMAYVYMTGAYHYQNYVAEAIVLQGGRMEEYFELYDSTWGSQPPYAGNGTWMWTPGVDHGTKAGVLHPQPCADTEWVS
jgi:hypothetical protein